MTSWRRQMTYAIAPTPDLQAIVDGYMRINTICLPAGHYRVEEGSEHYLFYELEERLARSFIHGHIVGLGIYLLSRWQENEPESVTAFMGEVGLKYHPENGDPSRRFGCIAG